MGCGAFATKAKVERAKVADGLDEFSQGVRIKEEEKEEEEEEEEEEEDMMMVNGE